MRVPGEMLLTVGGLLRATVDPVGIGVGSLGPDVVVFVVGAAASVEPAGGRIPHHEDIGLVVHVATRWGQHRQESRRRWGVSPSVG